MHPADVTLNRVTPTYCDVTFTRVYIWPSSSFPASLTLQIFPSCSPLICPTISVALTGRINGRAADDWLSFTLHRYIWRITSSTRRHIMTLSPLHSPLFSHASQQLCALTDVYITCCLVTYRRNWKHTNSLVLVFLLLFFYIKKSAAEKLKPRNIFVTFSHGCCLFYWMLNIVNAYFL